MQFAYRLVAIVVALAVAFPAAADKKKKKKDPDYTQALELPKDLPAAIVADTQRLSFQTAPLLGRGLLSAQVKEGIKALLRQHRGAQIVRMRAYVAGSGDSRRVGAIVSEEFTAHKLPLPVLTVVHVGALPMENAQVALESVAVEKKSVNPHGLLFLSGQQVTDPNPEAPTAPLLQQSLDRLAKLAGGAEMVTATCYVSVLPDAAARQALAAKVPPAFQLVQMQRATVHGMAECEAIARPSEAVAGLSFRDQTPNYSQVAVVNTPQIVMSGLQLGFQNTDADVKLAFTRLEKALEAAGGSLKHTAVLRIYPLQERVVPRIRAARAEFVGTQKLPASTLVLVESLPSLDAVFGIDAITAKRD